MSDKHIQVQDIDQSQAVDAVLQTLRLAFSKNIPEPKLPPTPE